MEAIAIHTFPLVLSLQLPHEVVLYHVKIMTLAASFSSLVSSNIWRERAMTKCFVVPSCNRRTFRSLSVAIVPYLSLAVVIIKLTFDSWRLPGDFHIGLFWAGRSLMLPPRGLRFQFTLETQTHVYSIKNHSPSCSKSSSVIFLLRARLFDLT